MSARPSCSAVAALLGTMGATLFANALPARAGTLDFTFTIPGNATTSGTVTGEIDGLVNNATSTPTAVYVYTAVSPSGTFAFPLPFNVVPYEDPSHDSITVANDQITSFDYAAYFPDGGDLNFFTGFDYYFELYDPPFEVWNVNRNIRTQPYTADGFATTLVTNAPEPSGVALLATGLAGLALRRRRSASATQSPAS